MLPAPTLSAVVGLSGHATAIFKDTFFRKILRPILVRGASTGLYQTSDHSTNRVQLWPCVCLRVSLSAFLPLCPSMVSLEWQDGPPTCYDGHR